MIPKIKEGILGSVAVHMTGPQRNTNWLVEKITELKLNNPVMAAFLLKASKKYGNEAAAIGIMVYEIIGSQMRADELNELMEV